MFRIRIALLIAAASLAVAGPEYVAFSLREAQRMVQAGSIDRTVSSVGGITRIVGMVYDKDGQDIILVGRKVSGLPEARFDDLVLALRMRLVRDEWPLVSIDPTPETPATLKQKVNFGGGIAGTKFGRDFLDCDVILKKYSLEQIASVRGTPSYRSLCLEDITRRVEQAGARVTGVEWLSPSASAQVAKGQPIQAEETYQTRFWFYPSDGTRLIAREGVFCVGTLGLCVKAELQMADRDGDTTALAGRDSLGEPGVQFAEEFSEHFQDVAAAQPLLRRLKVLFDMVAVGEGVRGLPERPDLSYLLSGYQPASYATPDEYDLAQTCALVERSDGLKQAVQISGGIAFRTEIEWLNDGDVTYLRQVVLKTRPSPGALAWTLPLQAWKMPNNQDLGIKPDTSSLGDPKAGCSVTAQSFTLGPPGGPDAGGLGAFSGFSAPSVAPSLSAAAPRFGYFDKLGGVDMATEPIGEKKDLQKEKKEVLDSRPSETSPKWDINGDDK